MTPASMLRLHFTKPHIKYHFGCDVTIARFMKTTQKTKSRSQIHQIVFEVPDVENIKIVLFAISVMLPISNLNTVSGTSLVSLSAEIDQHKPQKGCRNTCTCSSSCRFKIGNSKLLFC